MFGQKPIHIHAPLARQLGTKPIALPPVGSGGMNAAMFYGYSPQAWYRPSKPPIDRPINLVPAAEREPESEPPQFPLWINANCPPFVCPPFWSVPVDLPFNACVPWYEVATSLGCEVIAQDRALIIRGISYEALNASLDDVFEITILVNNMPVAVIEDVYVQNTPNPAQRYALAGHFRPMPLNIIADRNASICVKATLRGPITYAGVSPYFPGQPIVSADCQIKVLLQGYLANLREDLDGGPRPTDLGDFGGIIMQDDQSRGGFP